MKFKKKRKKAKRRLRNKRKGKKRLKRNSEVKLQLMIEELSRFVRKIMKKFLNYSPLKK